MDEPVVRRDEYALPGDERGPAEPGIFGMAECRGVGETADTRSPMSRTPNTSWRASLASRLAVVWSLLVGLAVGISAWMVHQDAREHLQETLRQGIEQDEGEIRLKMEAWVDGFREDARFFSASPLLAEFLRHRGDGAESQWRGLLEEEFRAMLIGKSAYFQMRVLAVGGAEDGDELLRLDRFGTSIEVTPREKLQSKVARPYFQEARAIPGGDVYLSEINLNRDFGVLTEPHIPTLRAATKVTAPGGREALVIINADLRPLLADLGQLVTGGAEVRIAGERGDFLMHPDSAQTFASDTGSGTRMAEELGSDPTPGWMESEQGEEAWTRVSQFVLEGRPDRPLTVLLSLPRTAWSPELEQIRRRAVIVTALASLLGAGTVFLLSQPLVARLRLLSRAIEDLDGGRMPPEFTGGAKDEVGAALARFHDMARSIRRQVETLEEARRKAEEADAAKEEFLAVMSHEIRTPMNAVVGLIRALEDNGPAPQQAPILRSLRASAGNLMALLNSALDYSRLKEEAISFSRDDFDVTAMLREVVQSYSPQAMAKGLRLGLREPEERLVMRGDAVRLRQVLNNLVNNAVKFTTEGFVQVAAGREGDALVIRVEDSGPGIAEAEQENVFAPFARAGEHRESGAGLGLAVSRALLEQQGGDLSFETTPGKGTTFTARLPWVAPHKAELADAVTAPVDSPVLRLRGCRLLCVEDVASNREVLTLTLAGSGVDLEIAECGEEALTRLGEVDYDLVLLDLQLPDMGGEELARRIRERRPYLPLLAVTAQASVNPDDLRREAGIGGVVLKPYEAGTLFDAIEAALDLAPPDQAALADLHPQDLARSGRLAGAIALEFEEAAADLRRAMLGAPDGFAAEAGRLRHQLTTPLERLGLKRIATRLEDLRDGNGAGEDEVERLAVVLEEAARSLRGWEGRQEAERPGP